MPKKPKMSDNENTAMFQRIAGVTPSPQPMTVDDLITALNDLKKKSNLKGRTIVHLCVQHCPYIPVVSANVENDEDGSVILLHPEFEP